jgi:polyisoprenoid-binding protein YceI
MNKRLSSAALATLLFAVPAAAALQKSGSPAVSFHAVGPGGLAIVGNSGDLSVSDQGGKVVFTTQLNSLSTGISMRDSHMKEKYLETGKFPTATLSIDRAQIQFPKGHGDNNLSGQITIHGVTHSVGVHCVADGGDKAANFDCSVNVNMKDFGIEVPSYLGVTVKPNVTISVKVGLNDA